MMNFYPANVNLWTRSPQNTPSEISLYITVLPRVQLYVHGMHINQKKKATLAKIWGYKWEIKAKLRLRLVLMLAEGKVVICLVLGRIQYSKETKTKHSNSCDITFTFKPPKPKLNDTNEAYQRTTFVPLKYSRSEWGTRKVVETGP